MNSLIKTMLIYSGVPSHSLSHAQEQELDGYVNQLTKISNNIEKDIKDVATVDHGVRSMRDTSFPKAWSDKYKQNHPYARLLEARNLVEDMLSFLEKPA